MIWMMASHDPSNTHTFIPEDKKSIASSILSETQSETNPLVVQNTIIEESESVPAILPVSESTSSFENESNATEESENGLKLGLGDFVFYSVLVGRAALNDWVTTITCTITVLSGLTMTIIILALSQRALPALPISIIFGILFFFLSAVVLVPFLDWLTPLDPKVNVTLTNGLWLGKSDGATTFMV